MNAIPEAPKFQTQSGKIYQGLRDEFLSGRLKPGTRLIRRVLSARYGTSAVAVAEALWKLESDGLVKSEPMYGSHVASFTPGQIRGELLLRQALETEVARLCAERAPELPGDELGKKAAALDAVMSSGRDIPWSVGIEIHAEFHLALARCCGSEAIARQLDRIWFRHAMVRSVLNAAPRPVPADSHQGLLRAILSGDPDRADLEMRNHVAFGGGQLIEIAGRS